MGRELDRPAVLTRAVQKSIVESLRDGNYLSTACTAAGTTVETFNYWRRLWESGAEHAQVYADFFTAVKRASATAEQDAIRDLKEGDPGWQAKAWFLERRFAKRWAKKDVVVVQSQKAPEDMSDDELADAAKQVRGARRDRK